MADIAVFGVMAVDVVLRVSALPPPGGQVTGESLGWRLGGSSANLACALSSAGHRVRLVGPVGSDPVAAELVAELSRWGVDTHHLVPSGAPTPRALILLEPSGERAIVGLDADAGDGPVPHRVPADLAGVDCAYVESYTRFPPSIADAGPALVVTSPPPPGRTQWPADVVVGSVDQLHGAARRSPYAALRAVAGPRLRWVVVTRGARGADAYGEDHEVHVPALGVSQVDATGAGDAFAAGLVHGLLAGRDMAEAMRLGAAWGGEAVTRLQSLPPRWEDLLGGPPPRRGHVGARPARHAPGRGLDE